ncbi:YihY/virulence factor BrkB family protein [Chthonobacter rhizosphaerae]|uniref:YihY/virulence factor BrkB family protein n=1 Tax=Chthonobacter rhizosphaerae TaxID=2735553 RepID=UPI0015EF1A32|nr:YihY/virulence factor BrkB family protein [Chthonobacter rhizosphaerae]
MSDQGVMGTGGRGSGANRKGVADALALAVAVGLAWQATSGRPRPRYRFSGTSERSLPDPATESAAGRPAQADDAARGRHATRPSEIPARGWKDVLWRTWSQIGTDRVVAVGAGVAFYGLLAIFPFLAAFVSLYGLVADPATVGGHLETLSGVLPAEAMGILGEQMQRLAANDSNALGFGFVFGLAVALWSANAGMKALFDALNVAYGETEKRSFIKLNALTLMFTLLTVVFLIVAIGVLVVLPAVLDALGLGVVGELLLRYGRWPILFVIVSLAIATLYRYGPSRATAKWRWVTWGSVVATVLFVAVSVGFSYYASNFGSYNETYGSLGAVIAFMTWLWLSATVVLVGAELNAEIEHQTLKDSTTGPPAPAGRRGALMADTVGAPQD